MSLINTEDSVGYIENLVQKLKLLENKCNRDIQIKNISNVYSYVRDYNLILARLKEQEPELMQAFNQISLKRGFWDLFFGDTKDYENWALHRLTSMDYSATKILSIFDQFEASPNEPYQDIRSAVKVFIGHGKNPQWKELKDHLHDKHDVEVEYYERGARAGFSIQEVLEKMIDKSSFALLVFTAEDEDSEGKMHARENVIHELGLFQARLGWNKAVILLEEGITEFSNIHGLNQIRFPKGHIESTFGEVVATIRRDFK